MPDLASEDDIPMQPNKKLVLVPKDVKKDEMEFIDVSNNADMVDSDDGNVSGMELLKSLMDDEAEEVNFIDEVEIRRDDMKYMNLAVNDDDNDKDEN